MKIVGLIGVVFALAPIGCSAVAQSQEREPTNIELRAAYCMIFMKNTIEFGQKVGPSASELERMKALPQNDPEWRFYNKFIDAQNSMISDYNRYREFVLFTLTRNVDALGMLLAEKQAQNDNDRLNQLIVKANCPSILADPSMNCVKAVQEKPEVKSISERAGGCGHSNWLPF